MPSDEEIRLNLILSVDEAVNEAKRFVDQVNQVKEVIQSIAKDAGVSFSIAAQSFKTISDAMQQNIPTKVISTALKELETDAKTALNLFKDESNKSFDSAVAGAKRFTEQVNQAKIAIQNVAKEANVSLRVAAQSLQGMPGLSQFGLSSRAISDALRELENEAKPATESISGLGTVSKFVFGTVLGISAVQALRDLIGYFKDAMQSAIDFTQSQLKLEVAIRGLQRSGLSTSLQEWSSLVADLKNQFPIFSKQELIDATSLAALMTREFGFTTDQIKELVRVSIVLSQITGKDLIDEVRGVTYAIGSGYTESLQRAGVNISRFTIQERAASQGYRESYQALDPLIRAQLTYEEVLEGVADLQADANAVMKTAAGMQKTLESTWKDFTVELGQRFLPLWKIVVDVLVRAIDGFLNLANLIQTVVIVGFSDIVAFVSASIPAIDNFWKSLSGKGGDGYGIDDFIKSFNEIRNNLRLELLSQVGIIDKSFLSDVEIDTGFIQNALREAEKLSQIAEIVQKLMDDISKIVEDGNEKLKKLEQDFINDMMDIDIEYARRKEDLWINLQQRLEDISRQYNQRLEDIERKRLDNIADENRNYQDKVRDALLDAIRDREKAERDYRDKQLEEEQRFQEAMRQLRERFLMELEDAVRERDARAVIRAMRQYNFEKTNLINEHELRVQKNEKDFRDELEDIERRKQERLRQLADEHRRRLEEINRQAQREREQAALDAERKRADALLNYQRELADLELWLERKRQARLAEYEREKEDLRKAIRERIAELGRAYASEYSLTVQWAKLIYDALLKYYGPNGAIDQLYQYMIARIQQMNEALKNAPSLDQFNLPPPTASPTHVPGAGRAEGGVMIANKPTSVVFGEAGWEMATFTPLHRRGATIDRVWGALPAGISMASRQDNLKIQVLLSPGLEAEIMENTMGEVANVLTSIYGGRR